MKKNEATPILVANEEWPLPETLIKGVQAERMVNSLIGLVSPLEPEESVGWAECVAYLMPAVCKATLRSDVAEIYLYCVGKLKHIDKLEGFKTEIGLPTELSDYNMQKLKEFKLWIYKHRGGKINNPVVSALKEVFFNKQPKLL